MPIDLERKQREYEDSKTVAFLMRLMPDGAWEMQLLCRRHIELNNHHHRAFYAEEYASAVANAVHIPAGLTDDEEDALCRQYLEEGGPPVLFILPQEFDDPCDDCHLEWLEGAIERGELDEP